MAHCVVINRSSVELRVTAMVWATRGVTIATHGWAPVALVPGEAMPLVVMGLCVLAGRGVVEGLVATVFGIPTLLPCAGCIMLWA